MKIKVTRQTTKEVEVELPLFAKSYDKYYAVYGEETGVSIYLSERTADNRYNNIMMNPSGILSEDIAGERITAGEFLAAKDEAIRRINAVQWDFFKEKEEQEA